MWWPHNGSLRTCLHRFCMVWLQFGLPRERERKEKVRERVLRNRSQLDKGWHNEGPLHIRDTASLIILTRVALSEKLSTLKPAARRGKNEKVPCVCYTCVLRPLQHVAGTDCSRKKKKNRGNTKIVFALCLMLWLAVFIKRNWTERNLFTCYVMEYSTDERQN